MNQTIPRLAKEPVLQFLILGGAFFITYATFAPPEAPPREEIVITAARVESLTANFERAWRRPPTEQEREGLIEDYLTEELMYREALKIGLDRDDLVVRRRMRQKVELLLGDALAAALPGEEALRAHYEAEKKDYRTPDRLSFQQVFLGPLNDAERPTEWDDLVKRMNGDQQFDFASIGAPSLLPPAMNAASTRDIDRSFGADFSASLIDLPVGAWAGPVSSSYGRHLVRIETVSPGEIPSFEDVRETVSRDLQYQREREARDELIDRLKQSYDISIERAIQ